jgi:hypothetical protein
MLALANLCAQRGGLFVGHPERSVVTLVERSAPEQEKIDTVIVLAVARSGRVVRTAAWSEFQGSARIGHRVLGLEFKAIISLIFLLKFVHRCRSLTL